VSVRELEPCPKCESGDVGGGNGIAHCYKCKHEVRAATTPEAVDLWNIRAIAARFTEQEWGDDSSWLKVDTDGFARALLERERQAAAEREVHAQANIEMLRKRGLPYYAADGTFMNADGSRSIFDDVDE
jgi:hypothetical protein